MYLDDLFTGTTSLWKLTLGERTILDPSTNLLDPPGNNTVIPGTVAINVLPLWQAVGDGTPNSPTGAYYSAYELMTLYQTDVEGTHTYVWAQDAAGPITLQYVDVTTGKLVAATTLDGIVGQTLNLSDYDEHSAIGQSMPDNYQYATGAALGGYQQPENLIWTITAQTAIVYVLADEKSGGGETDGGGTGGEETPDVISPEVTTPEVTSPETDPVVIPDESVPTTNPTSVGTASAATVLTVKQAVAVTNSTTMSDSTPPTASTDETLPQTDTTNQSLLALIGLGMMALLGGLGKLVRRNK